MGTRAVYRSRDAAASRRVPDPDVLWHNEDHMVLRTHALALLLAGASPPAPEPDPALACSDTARLAQRIDELAGRPVDPREVGVRLRILEVAPLRARVELELAGRVDARELEAPSCDALFDAVALLVAVTLDPAAVPEPPPQEPAPAEPEPEPEPQPQEPAPPEPAPMPVPTPVPVPTPISPPPPPPRARPPIRMAVGLLAGGELGAIPRGTGGLRPVLRLSRGAFAAELSGDYWIRRRRPLPSGELITVELGVAALRACGIFGRGRVRAPLCGGLEVGAMRGEGVGLRDARSDRWPWAAALVSAGAAVRVGQRWDLTAVAEGFVPFVRPSFSAVRDDDSVVLYVPSPVGGRLLLGVQVELLSVTDRSR